VVLDQEFTVDGGELTPTLKIKRKVIANIHQETIIRLYNEAKL
jgi:long-subunit acyl-CoA synthetase (AMP-forming)